MPHSWYHTGGYELGKDMSCLGLRHTPGINLGTRYVRKHDMYEQSERTCLRRVFFVLECVNVLCFHGTREPMDGFSLISTTR